MHGEGNTNREVKKLDGKGKVDNKGTYQSRYYTEKLELKPPGETLVQSSYLRDEEVVVFTRAAACPWLRDASKR